jgi:hypothetical protein
MRCARKALTASLDSSEDHVSIVRTFSAPNKQLDEVHAS